MHKDEKLVKEELEELGYSVTRYYVNPLDVFKGYPDFLCEKDKKRFWVEVKSKSGLDICQIQKFSEIISKHKEKIYIFIVNENKISKYQLKISEVSGV